MLLHFILAIFENICSNFGYYIQLDKLLLMQFSFT